MDKKDMERLMCLRDLAMKKLASKRSSASSTKAKIKTECLDRKGTDLAQCLRTQIHIRKTEKTENKMDMRMKKTSNRMLKIEQQARKRKFKKMTRSSASSSAASSASSEASSSSTSSEQ